MAVSLSPLAGAGWQFFSDDGVPLAGGKLYTYNAGTTILRSTYTSKSGAVANTNPIILDSAGRVPYEIWLTLPQEYKFILKTANDVLIRTWDYIPSKAPDILYEYSSGTFTPTLSGSNTGGTLLYSVQEGNYTKLNNIVTFSLTIVVGGITVSPSGDLSISGLPKLASSTITKQAVYIGEWSAISLPSSRVGLAGYIAASATSIKLIGTATGLASSFVQSSGISTSTTITVSGSYKANE